MRLIAVLVIFSLAGCAGISRPDALVCGVNAKSKTLRCYNIKKDYSDAGVLLHEAQPTVKPISGLADLNGGLFFSPADTEKLKVWMQDARDYAKEHCQ